MLSCCKFLPRDFEMPNSSADLPYDMIGYRYGKFRLNIKHMVSYSVGCLPYQCLSKRSSLAYVFCMNMPTNQAA